MKNHYLVISIISIIFINSCASRKDLVYFQDEPLEAGLLVSEPEQLVYKPDDILTINVSALDPDTVRPFNLPLVANNTNVGLNAQAQLQVQSYLVDYDGNIQFPVLGALKVEGLTRTELTSLLTEKISAYANDPIVNVRLANFTITIIGEVSRPGTFTIQDERITLLEALGMANDLTIFGARKNILIIREVEGKKKFATIDLTSINTVNSPVYYLQQNDVIYVEPNNAKIQDSVYNRSTGLFISMASVIISLITVLTR